MVENVQCPVCTLFLHAGMNLSDHLETHPKEQVIKALVQLTISGSGSGIASGVLKAALSGETKTEDQESNTSTKNENDMSRSNSRLSTISSSSTLCSTNSSLNLATPFSTQSIQHQEHGEVKTPQTYSNDVRLNNAVSNTYDPHNLNSNESYQGRSNGSNEKNLSYNSLKAMNFSRYHQQQLQHQQQQQQQPPQSHRQELNQPIQLHHTTSSQLQNAHEHHQPFALSKQNNNLQQHLLQENLSTTTQPLPPPPPPLPVQRHQTQQQAQQHHQPQQSIHQMQQPHKSSLTSTTSATTFSTDALYASARTRQQSMQHQQQSIKNVYPGGSGLPPPPPLQLFPYQQSPQHQKPPPAYGAAISQIRSQQNQNKQNNANSSNFLYSQAPHSHLQRHATSNPPRIMSHLQTELTTALTSTTFTSTTTSTNSSTTKHIVQERNSSAGILYAYDQKTSNYILKVQQHTHQHQENRQLQTSNAKDSDVSTLEGSHENSSSSQSTAEMPEKVTHSLPPPQNSSNAKSTVAAITSFASSVSVSYSTSGPNSRHTNSPFTSILSSPSPSSVLRYAESPVAHYLERDNGDFIVQETPKHIVECVEEEDGEFSVIERFHQSPPSVLHIHDDNDDEEVEESQVDGSEKRASSSSGNAVRKRSISKKDQSDQTSENDEQEFLSLKKNDENNEKDQEQGGVKRETKLSSMSSSCPEAETNSGSSSNTSDASSKKSSKNSITVLSDVQLNLNEYLDLVGNIIASSKIAKRRSNCVEPAPIPLLKVEKVELTDDEYDAQLTDNDSRGARSAATQDSGENTSSEKLTLTELSSMQQLHKSANNNETEQQLLELTSNTFEHKNHFKSEDVKNNKNKDDQPMTIAKSCSKTLMTPGSSSHVTSVIRMASAVATIRPNDQNQPRQESQQQVPETNHEKAHHQQNKNVTTKPSAFIADDNAMAQDLSQPQKLDKTASNETGSFVKQIAHSGGLPPPPPLRKGPKKLVIKLKTTKTDENAKNVDFNETNIINEIPTTSRLSQKESSTVSQSEDLIIKFEPSSYEISCSSADKVESVENNLQSKESLQQKALIENQPSVRSFQDHQNQMDGIECKTEKLSHADDSEINFLQSQSNLSDTAVDYRPIKSERTSNRNELCPQPSERKKSRNTPDKDSATEDARVLLDFANSSKCAASGITIAPGVNFFSSHSLFTSCTSSKMSEHSNSKIETNSNSDTVGNSIESSLRCEDEFIAVDEHELQEIISSTYSRSTLPGSSKEQNERSGQAQTQLDDQQEQQHQQQQQQQQQPHSSFAECPFSFFYNNGNGVESLPRTSITNQFSPTYHQTPDATTTAATVASSSTLDTMDDSISTPAESNGLQNRFGNVQGALPQWYQSATLVANSDFESALSIDNAAVDGDVGKYLDLDACKKESSCSGARMAPSSTSSSFAVTTDNSLPSGCTNDALNIRTDEKMPPKGEISEQESNCDIENSWSQPVYGEIPSRFYRTSFPGIFPQENHWNHEEFFTVQDLSHSTGTAPTSNNNNKSTKSFDFHLPLEATPTTFVNSNLQLLHDDVFPSTSLGSKKKRKRVSGDSANKPTATITSQQFLQNAQIANQSLNQQQTQHQPKPTTSSAALMASSTSTSTTSQPKTRKKVYKCPHCSTEFSKLRDRNSHMIDSHNYVRQNRRLISSQATVPLLDSTSANPDASVISASETLLTFRSNANNSSAIASRADDFLLESKHNIKIEMEYEQQAAMAAHIQNIPHQPEMALHEGVDTKSEFVEEKETLTAMVVDTSSVGGLSGTTEDKKPTLSQSHSLNAPTTKLATLYRMLVSYNVSTLKQNQNLTEFEEKLIENSIFFCYTCRTNFSSVKLYDAHLTEHPAECFTCGKKFQRWKNFSLHLKRHLGWKEFACTVCDKKFVVRSALVEHTRMHTGQTPLKCKVCGKCFKRYSNLTQHRKRHGRVHVRKKEYVCHCGEVLPSKARFLWHKETHDSKPKCCPHCCDRFVHANSLRRHIRLAHSDKFDYAEPMECPMCKQVFAKSSIKAHMATHSMDTQHDCKICNKSFSTKWNLKIHLWVHANRTAKPFKCEHCPKAFVREVDFKNHMNAHKQIKPYTCEYCGCKFIRKYNYMRHRREHHGNKKFTCELCMKSFHRHYYLIEHRRIHTGERPFQCTICGKSSTTKTNHNKHLKIHHSRDPFTVET